MGNKTSQKKVLKILVTAGPTREPIDAVRFISNYSTGFLGYEIARRAKARGHRVFLISGPTQLERPKGVAFVGVETARQLQEELKKRFNWCDCLMMAAAVGDFRAQRVSKRKIKRGNRKELLLRLKANPDLLQELGRKKGQKILAAVALESENLAQNAQKKIRQKNLDLIVATQLKVKKHPFGRHKLDAFLLSKDGQTKYFRDIAKTQLARILLDSIEKAMLN